MRCLPSLLYCARLYFNNDVRFARANSYERREKRHCLTSRAIIGPTLMTPCHAADFRIYESSRRIGARALLA